MSESTNVVYIALIVIYIAVIGWYVTSVLLARKKKEEESGHKSHRIRRRGKRCPNCKQIIDERRTLCHHCGHEFEAIPGLPPHPDEVRSGRRKPESELQGSAKT